MDNETDNTTHNEMVFRNFIRSHQLTAKWHEFIKENPLEVRQMNLENPEMVDLFVYGVFDRFRIVALFDLEEEANEFVKKMSGIHEVKKLNKKICYKSK